MTVARSGCLSVKQIVQLNDKLNELSFEFGSVLDEAFEKLLNAEFEVCDASDIPADTGGEEYVICITDGVCAYRPKSEVVNDNETLSTISYDVNSQSLTFTGEDGNPVVIDLSGLLSTAPTFNPATCEMTFVGPGFGNEIIDLSLLDSEAPTFDAATGDLTFTNAKGVATAVNIGIPTPPEPNCFYVDGDKLQANAANKICDAIDNGEAIGILAADGSVDEILAPATSLGFEDYLQAQGATNVDTTTWTYEGAVKFGLCCEEEVCGLRAVTTTHNTAREVDAAAGVTTMYRPDFPYQSTTTVTNLDGSVKTVFGNGAFLGTGIVTAEAPVYTTFEEATVTTEDGDVCEPECIEWSYLIGDIDITSRFEVLNPADVTSVTVSGDTANGTWLQDPGDPNVWNFTLTGTNPSANIRFIADCDKDIIVQFQTDFVAQQFRQTVRPAAKVKYVCDPQVVSNRVSAEGPNGLTLNPATIDIP
jgi:hypothetical protein